MKRLTIKSLTSFLLLIICIPSFAQDAKWVEVSGEAILEGNKTRNEVQNEALQDAKRKAIELICGVTVKDRIMILEKSDDPVTKAVSLTECFSSGRIIEEKNIKWSTETKVIQEGKAPVVIYIVNLEIKVVKNVKSSKSFNLNLSLNQEQFYTGDQIRIKVNPSEDCYITILNFASDNNVYVLFPNPYQKENFIKKDHDTIIPSNSEIKRGIEYEVSLPIGINSHIEVIKVIGSKKNNPIKAIDKLDRSVGGYKVFSSTTDYTKVTKWILSLPDGEFAEEDIQYNIIRK
ncbi:DUF4384 domain-containing protein [candidate division KSB1 bacterium]